MYPNICERNEFTWDKERFYTNQKAFIIPDASKFLLGILNSSVVMFLFTKLIPRLQNDFYEPGGVFLRDFPVVTASKSDRATLVGSITRILTAKQIDASADVSDLEREIDERVYRLYGLTKDEIAIVEGE